MEENVTLGAEELPATDAAVSVTEEVPQKKKRKPVNQQKLQDNLWGWAFCLPLIVGTVLFVYFALVISLLMSFTNFRTGGDSVWDLMNKMFSGDRSIYDFSNISGHNPWFENGAAYDPFYWYRYIFTEKVWAPDVNWTNSDGAIKVNATGYTMFNTVFYLIGIPIGMVLAVFFAVCMSRDIKGGNIFRVLYYVPCVASTISIIYTFKILFAYDGVIKNIIGVNLPWMGGEPGTWGYGAGVNPYWTRGLLSKTMIVIMSVWKGLGGTIILYVAGLSGVNASTKEAAQIDGANSWKIFWKVTMPDLYPVIFYNLVTAVIGGMQIYAEPELFFTTGNATDGGLLPPNLMTSGYVSLIWFYGSGMRGAHPSLGAAYGMILAVIIFILTLFQFWLDSRKKD